ncbi:MAG TPA: Spy/CpxP family protein refolding chaperone [Oligoflexus sp.]|uniref:Spy/CpxP family protein refolding chaperone n=1 Tax=Oligoflexus sp. TaxID=1971216 RepID=UPI002D800649|nr:Spy/CpxP family protein refolding chaperone [Oligoflexus sp.]HET9236481.1 Spy/CpxP family protein refolding chaperone [Oligoflexus sp.]
MKFLLSSILMLHSLTALAQGEADGDLGVDPGLPSEAPATQAPAPTPPTSTRQAPSATLPAPAQEGLVQPYEGTTPPATVPMPKTAPAPKARPAISGKLAELNLSAEQTQQIIDIRRQWRPDAEKRLKEDFAFLKQNLAQAMADNSSGEEVRRRFELMQRKYLELQTMKFEKLLRIREVLTPDQRKKFAELRSRPSRNNNNDND